MKCGIWLILAVGLSFNAVARADDSANMAVPGQIAGATNRMFLLKKLHRKHIVPPAFAMPGFSGPQAGNTGNAQPPALPADHPQANDTSPAPVADPGNPYATIVTRNVFGLNPLPTNNPADQQQGPPPPKITLTGITTIFGPPEALFTVAGVVRDGRQPHDESYIFTEGEAQDNVEVVSIDTKKNVVTFNNHDVVQVIPLVEGTASTGSGPSAPSWPGQNFRPHRFGRFGGRPPGGGPDNSQPSFQPSSYNSGQPNNNGYGGNDNANNSAGGFNNYNNGQPSNVHNYSTVSPGIAALSDQDQQALIAAQHAQMEQEGNPLAPLMPPTELDDAARQEAAGANGANPGSGNPGGRTR